MRNVRHDVVPTCVVPLGRTRRVAVSVPNVYDMVNRLVATVNPLGFRTSFGYDAASQQVSVTDALGNISTTVFDPDGRTLAKVDANGFRTTQVYDAIGELLAVVDARGNRNSMSYDAPALAAQHMPPGISGPMFLVQSTGSALSQGVQLTFPNTEGFRAGATLNLYLINMTTGGHDLDRKSVV